MRLLGAQRGQGPTILPVGYAVLPQSLIYMDSRFAGSGASNISLCLQTQWRSFLGPSEGVSRLAKFFGSLDKKHHIFQRRRATEDFQICRSHKAPHVSTSHHAGTPTNSAADDRIDRSARRALAKYSPVYVVIDGQENILRFSGGEVGRYLEPSAGAASFNLFRN